jgi:hypothetical protein
VADNVAITAGSGTTIATDDVGTVHYQRVKLVDGTLDSSAAIPGDATSGLWVAPRPSTRHVQVQSAGLTTATTAYTANDQLGTILTFAAAVRVSGGTGVLQSAMLLDQAAVTGAVDLYLFDRSVTLAADNAAAAFSDADMLFCLGVISFPAPVGGTGNSVVQSVSGLGISCNATSLFGALVTRTAHTFFGAATNLAVRLHLLQD